MSAQQTPKHPHEALLDALIRLIVLKVAEDFEPGELDSIMSLDTTDPRLVQQLKAHGDNRHSKLMSRKPEDQSQKYAPAKFGDSRTSEKDKYGRAMKAFIADNKQRIADATQGKKS